MDPVPLRPTTPPGSTRPLGPLAPRPDAARGTGKAEEGGENFRSLLERLRGRAQDLERTADAVESPAELPGAVEAARGSLEDALTLGERLLEAYRQSLQQQRGVGSDSA